VTTEDDEGFAGGIVVLMVILCVLAVAFVIAAIALFFMRRTRMDNNSNTTKGGMVNADNSGEIPEDAMDEHGAGVEVRARQFQVNLPPAEDNREAEEPEAIRM